MYWPKEGVETHGVIQVKLVNEDARATYTIRTFSIKHLKVFIVLANFMALSVNNNKKRILNNS
jgi:receptor-type tyrosine-protein phosphatase gamma